MEQAAYRQVDRDPGSLKTGDSAILAVKLARGNGSSRKDMVRQRDVGGKRGEKEEEEMQVEERDI